MKRSLVGAIAVALVSPVLIVATPPASASETGLEVSVDENDIVIIGHPSPVGASPSQVGGDIYVERQGNSLVVYVDEESGGSAQLWSTDPACSPATGSDVMRISCTVPGPKDAGVYIDLEGIDEEGSERVFAVTGDLKSTFVGSPYDDYFQGGSGSDFLEGGDGDDNLFGGAGDDRIVGGPGADTIEGEQGADVVEGGAGPDDIDVKNDRDPTTGAILDFAKDRVDCNDLASRGTDNSGAMRNAILYDRDGAIADSVTDCGTGDQPVNTSRPKIVGQPMVGIEVEGTLGTWQGKNLSYSFKWASCVNSSNPYTDCKDVQFSEDEDGRFYTPKSSDEGRLLLFSVFASNNSGEVEMTSEFSAVVTKPQGPTNFYPPFWLDMSPMEGRAVKFNVGTWALEKGDKFSYAVEYCYTLQTGTQKCRESASGAAQANQTISFTPGEDEVSNQLRVTVTAIRALKVGSKVTRLQTKVASSLSGAVRSMEAIAIPTSWEPAYDGKLQGYKYTRLSTATAWLDRAIREKFAVGVDIVYVGLPELNSLKQYADLKKYAKDVFTADGAILRSTPDFGKSIRGYSGMSPTPRITLVVYDKLRDLDSCARAIQDAGFRFMRDEALLTATQEMERLKCQNWKVEWSSSVSTKTFSTVQEVRVDTSVINGVSTSVVVIVARPPKVDSLGVIVQPLRYDEVQQYPDTLTLTWDGDIKAGGRSSFQLWPVLAATGQIVFAGRAASVEVFDVDGSRISSVSLGLINGESSYVDLRGIPISAVFKNPGTARVLVRFQDANYWVHEVFVDIDVRAPSGTFATLDGRCFTWTGTSFRSELLSACPAPSPNVKSLAEGIRKSLPGYDDKFCKWYAVTKPCSDTYATFQNALSYVGPTSADSYLSYSVLVVNGTYRTEVAQSRIGTTPRSGCLAPWLEWACRALDFFIPKPAKVIVRPYRKPAAPPPPIQTSLVQVPIRTLTVRPTQPVAGLTAQNGCTQLGAGQTMACGGAVSATQFPLNAAELANVDETRLLNLDGGTLAKKGGELLNLDGGTLVEQVSPAVAVQSGAGAQLTVPLTAGSLLNLDGGT